MGRYLLAVAVRTLRSGVVATRPATTSHIQLWGRVCPYPIGILYVFPLQIPRRRYSVSCSSNPKVSGYLVTPTHGLGLTGVF